MTMHIEDLVEDLAKGRHPVFSPAPPEDLIEFIDEDPPATEKDGLWGQKGSLTMLQRELEGF